MTEERFIARNEEKWKALEVYNRRLGRTGIKKLPRAEIREFAGLFRLAGYHRAYAKTHFPEGQALPYLNSVVGVAHNYFFIRESGGWSDILRYAARGFPSRARAASRYFWLSTGFFLTGALFAFFFVAPDAGRFALLFPDIIINNGGAGSNEAAWDYPLMSAFIMTNNIRVTLTAFALGVTGGVGTAAVLLYNGLIIGGLTAYVAGSGGDIVWYLSLILPHGIWELYAIFLSGACGLMIGRAVLAPGRTTRREALIKGAGEAAALIPGIVALLAMAGLVEGFFTPLAIAPGFKLAFAGLTLAGLAAYLNAGRGRDGNTNAD